MKLKFHSHTKTADNEKKKLLYKFCKWLMMNAQKIQGGFISCDCFKCIRNYSNNVNKHESEWNGTLVQHTNVYICFLRSTETLRTCIDTSENKLKNVLIRTHKSPRENSALVNAYKRYVMFYSTQEYARYMNFHDWISQKNSFPFFYLEFDFDTLLCLRLYS